MRWFELCLVLLIAFGAQVVSSIARVRATLPTQASYGIMTWILGCAREIIALALLVYVLRRRGLGLHSLGFKWSAKDAISGVWVMVAAVAMRYSGTILVRWFLVETIGSVGVVHSAQQVFGQPTLIAVPYWLLGPVFEELIVRAYLMTEVLELTGSSVLAILVSSILQTSYHLYYGWYGALQLFFVFLTYAVYFAIWKRALGVIVAHELMNLPYMLRLILPSGAHVA